MGTEMNTSFTSISSVRRVEGKVTNAGIDGANGGTIQKTRGDATGCNRTSVVGVPPAAVALPQKKDASLKRITASSSQQHPHMRSTPVISSLAAANANISHANANKPIVKSKVTKISRTTRTVNGTGLSAFQRRNARDSISNTTAPPPTASSVALLAIINAGKNKEGNGSKRNKMPMGAINSARPQVSQKQRNSGGVVPSRKRPPGSNNSVGSMQNNQDGNDSMQSNKRQREYSPNSVILAPPPEPTYQMPKKLSIHENSSLSNRGAAGIHARNTRSAAGVMNSSKIVSTRPRKRVSSHVFQLKNDEMDDDEQMGVANKGINHDIGACGSNSLRPASNSATAAKHESAYGPDITLSRRRSNSVNDNAIQSNSSRTNECTVDDQKAPVVPNINPYNLNSLRRLAKSDCSDRGDVGCLKATGKSSDDISAIGSEEINIQQATRDKMPLSVSSAKTTPAATDFSSDLSSKTDVQSSKKESSTQISLLGIGAKYNRKKNLSGFSLTSNRTRRSGDSSMRADAVANQKEPVALSIEVSGVVGNHVKGPHLGGMADVSINNSIQTPSNGEKDSNEFSDPFETSTANIMKKKHSEWYDPAEHAEMEKEASSNDQSNVSSSARNGEYGVSSGKSSRKTSKSAQNINDNFVRLDLRNSAGSCRGARNLKKLNGQKRWRARHRFGMGDGNDNDEDSEDNENGASGGYKKNPSHGKKNNSQKSDGGDTKCFASANNAGVDPLDDFMDGVFTKQSENIGQNSTKNIARVQGHTSVSASPRSGDAVPHCTRHERPCRLLTVKKNTKGNKGRKFYVCSMPRGEQCDFFKWEDDTVEATQRALLKSSSNSGFIARQVAASKARFKELTLPELRLEAKKRGLKTSGKKDQILARLLIWMRDEIAHAVDPSELSEELTGGEETVDARDSVKTCDGVEEKEVGITNDKVEVTNSKEDDDDGANKKMIELSDDESSFDDGDSDDTDSSCDELELVDGEMADGDTKPKSKRRPASTLHESLEQYFGYTSFRDGQEWAIQRCLSHKRTLLVAPTGQGKSLCYALPAALMEGICLVVSPLISLMQDQLRQLPPSIPAATLSGSMTMSQMTLIVDDILRGRYKVLFVSPERLASAAFRRLVRPKFNAETRKYERKFPVVSLLCVDEAHCLSQWGHNFRPSYLRVRSLLPLIEPKSILALTATAGPLVIRDICNTLRIHETASNGDSIENLQQNSNGECVEASGVKVLNCNRDNIDVFSLVLQSADERRYLLHKILKEKKGRGTTKDEERKLPIEEGCLSRGSVIVYVWRQKDTEIVAEQLNGAGISGGIVCYHGGMDSGDRMRAQSKFLRGKARICVATVAFGLGINKPDIEGVIHLCLPPSPEHYLQEIGRAGRDGRAAKAIALPLEDEVVSRHSLAHSDRLSTSQLRIVFLVLQKLVMDALGDIPSDSGVDFDADELFVDGLPVAMPVSQIVDVSDCKEESVETIFSILEEESPPLMSVEGYLPDVATITLKRRQLSQLEKIDPIAHSISKCGVRIDKEETVESGNEPSTFHNNSNSYNRYQEFGGTGREKGFFSYSFGTYTFSVVRCARCMGPTTEPRHVYAALRRLQSSGEVELSLDTSSRGRAMHLKMNRSGINLFRLREEGTEFTRPTDGNVGHIISKLMSRFSAKECTSVGKVESMHDVLHRVSMCHNSAQVDGIDTHANASDGESEVAIEIKSKRLVVFQSLIHSYFQKGPGNGESHQLSTNHQDADEVLNPTSFIIKDFPIENIGLASILSSDISSLMQLLKTRRQEEIPTAVHIDGQNCHDYRDLCITKILHAIDAPRAPILDWYSHPLWGKYRNYSFSSVAKAVTKSLKS